jgi:arginine/lysine/ornithine decarboxylase
MTGGAMLCANKSITKEQIKAKMAMFGSTSPSFPVLASVDFGISYIANNVSEYKKTAENVTLWAKKLRACGFYVQDNSEEESLRLCIDTFSIGYSAEETEEYLSQKSIFPEIAQNNRLLFLFSPFNKENEYEALFSALSSMEKRDPIKTQFKDTHVRPQRKISLRDALLYPTESIPTSKAVGRISAETFATCPPGMAIVVSGEEINEDTARILAKHKKQTEVVK